MSRSITIEREGEQITLTGWAGRGTPERCKSVAGARFRPETKYQGAHWTFPLTLGNCRALRAQFGGILVIGPALNRWATKAVAAERALEAITADGDADTPAVDALAPRLAEAMSHRTYQRVATRWGASVGNFLLADQQGLGKTLETLGTIIEYGEDEARTQYHLVLAPKVAVMSVWTPEIRRWLDDNHAVALPLTGSLPERQRVLSEAMEAPTDKAHVFVVATLESVRVRPHWDEGSKKRTAKTAKFDTDDAVLPALFASTWDTIVVDECQRALIRSTGALTQTTAGARLLKTHRRLALSGTPMRGKPEQLWGTLNWLEPRVYTSYWKWVKRYFQLSSNGYSNYLLNGFKDGGEASLASDLKPIMLRRTKTEVLSDLPPKTYGGSLLLPGDPSGPVGVWLEPSKGQEKQIYGFERDGLLDFGDDGEVMVDGPLAYYTRSKQLANTVHTFDGTTIRPTLDSAKYRWLVDEFLPGLDGAKVVLASQFTQWVDVVAEGLAEEGYTVATLTGKTPDSRRTEAVQSFQETDDTQVFILNTKAGGVALTLDAADYLVILDETTVPDDQEQVEDRLHRASRNHNVTVYYVRTLGTLDEEISLVAAARADIQQYLMDGARGVEYARKIYRESR
ncbi:MAG: DEAD/DEAH box helicase [Nocardioidaceae bacterium]